MHFWEAPVLGGIHYLKEKRGHLKILPCSSHICLYHHEISDTVCWLICGYCTAVLLWLTAGVRLTLPGGYGGGCGYGRLAT